MNNLPSLRTSSSKNSHRRPRPSEEKKNDDDEEDFLDKLIADTDRKSTLERTAVETARAQSLLDDSYSAERLSTRTASRRREAPPSRQTSASDHRLPLSRIGTAPTASFDPADPPTFTNDPPSSAIIPSPIAVRKAHTFTPTYRQEDDTEFIVDKPIEIALASRSRTSAQSSYRSSKQEDADRSLTPIPPPPKQEETKAPVLLLGNDDFEDVEEQQQDRSAEPIESIEVEPDLTVFQSINEEDSLVLPENSLSKLNCLRQSKRDIEASWQSIPEEAEHDQQLPAPPQSPLPHDLTMTTADTSLNQSTDLTDQKGMSKVQKIVLGVVALIVVGAICVFGYSFFVSD